MKVLVGFVLWLWLLPQALALSNQLQSHPSPYLALHGDDPVAWQEWGPDAFENARRQNKLVYVSVGYFSCHWCHVMQGESYKNPGIAKALNRDFVPVKVDRELQPALDEALMAFVQSTQGRGGWPLNVFLTPEGYPLYAVLYVPPESFAEVIGKIQALWSEDPAGLAALARQHGPQGYAEKTPQLDPAQVLALGQAFEQMALALADTFEGGFGNQSRFPHVPQLRYLLGRYGQAPSASVREVLETTLDAMAQRGLYDHVEGGFFRYTVDPGWSVPHFEKMLYGNAQLALLYLKAGRVLRREDYSAVGFAVLDFMLARMQAGNGAMVASLSAIDDQGREGAYYLFDDETLENALTRDEQRVLRAAWSLPEAAAFEFGHLLVNQAPPQVAAIQLGWTPDDIENTLASAMGKLSALRDGRSLPVDDKALAGWNALALEAFVEGAIQSDKADYAHAARQIKRYIQTTLWQDDRLLRARARGSALGTVSLADYAYTARALLAFSHWSRAADDFVLAHRVAQAAWRDFHRANGWQRETDPLLKGGELHEVLRDEALPAADAVLIEVSLRLAEQEGNSALAEKARSALNRAHDTVMANAFFFPSRIRAPEVAIAIQDEP
ncbi:MAG TPA: thioredoxin domain-containing protein [Gammaproteobacteria bacterium]|nr:thioredoxin domain-containing protein [Gammaproteobacteria bacterium]